MKAKTGVLIQLAILAASLLISVYYYGMLPENGPTHWDIHGNADQYGSKWQNLGMGPCLILLMLGMTVVLPKISPKNFEIEQFSGTYAYAMVLVSALMLLLSIVILRAAAGSKFQIEKGMMAAIFLFFALLGNVLGRVRRNFFIGIRTPWTIASEPVWDATHRFAGYLWVVGGIVGTAVSLLGVSMVFTIPLLLVIAFLPVVHSYFLYQRIEKS
jgi:uncharacterized membrane protein